MQQMLMTAIVIVVAALFSACAASEEKAGSAPVPAAAAASAAENVAQAIRQLVTERDQAVQQGDTAALDRIYTADYVATSDSGLVRTKAQVIEDLVGDAQDSIPEQR